MGFNAKCWDNGNTTAKPLFGGSNPPVASKQESVRPPLVNYQRGFLFVHNFVHSIHNSDAISHIIYLGHSLAVATK
jgi:hypothetical protein